MRKLIKILCAVFSSVTAVLMALVIVGAVTLPGEFRAADTKDIRLSEIYFIKNINKSAGADSDDSDGAAVSALKSQNKFIYEADISLFGLIPVKTAQIRVNERYYAVPSGEIFGLRLYTDGVIVIATEDIVRDGITVNPAEKAGIQKGDIVKTINGAKITKASQLSEILEKCGGDDMILAVKRGNLEFNVTLSPVASDFDGRYKAGLWVRDSSAGIGTLTFYDRQTGVYAGLGHAVCDVDTFDVLPISGGDILTARLSGIYKGSNGSIGELCGTFGDKVIGSLEINGNSGVYGKLIDIPADGAELPVASKQEVRTGPAQIISTIDDSGPQYYNIEIIKVNPGTDSNEKNMTVRVTDERLLEKTGGIVQGMSGSPIIQEGMLAGAVTHVFLNNCKEGYAIFAENMFKTIIGAGDELLEAA
ncbi:MAG: SpoIVB peptidase [Oscillospiraceae bacterium]|nr:SpoIVB peptidase [Oscillospiraceae bacterium]